MQENFLMITLPGPRSVQEHHISNRVGDSWKECSANQEDLLKKQAGKKERKKERNTVCKTSEKEWLPILGHLALRI